MSDFRLPHFLVIGAQKSASTFIQDALRTHPDVYMPAGETRFFEDPEYGKGDLAELAALFNGRQERLLGIKRPDYLARQEVPARIHAALPMAKLIVVLRKPLDRLVSAYYYYIKLGLMPVADINEVLPTILRGERTDSPKAQELLSYGNYATHLKRYHALFAAGQILVLLQEDIQASRRQTLDRTCSFLGIDSRRLAAPARSSNAGVYPLARLRFLTRRNRFLYDYDESTGKLRPKSMTLARFLPAAAITAVDRYFLARAIGNSKPPLTRDLEAGIKDYYQREVAETEQLIGRDLRSWR